MISLIFAATATLAGLNVVQHHRLQLARHDPLTGLATRRLWKARAERMARRPKGLVVLIIDGDDFKQINDLHGHEVGDTVLVAFAQRLLNWAGPRRVVGRLGGDEFAVCLRAHSDDDLAKELDALCCELSLPVRYRGRTVKVGASIGVAFADEYAAPTLFHTMRAADEAMYQAKRAGRGTWHPAERPVERLPTTPQDGQGRQAERSRSTSADCEIWAGW